MKKTSIVIRLLGTFVGILIGLVLYFFGVAVGVAWSATKTGFHDGSVKNITKPPF